MSKRGHGETCTYCERTLESVLSPSPLAATRDHVIPKSKGRHPHGEVTVWACRLCNSLKRDMMPDDWQAFMECYPEWWKHAAFAKFGRAHTKQRPPNPNALAVIPMAETQMILQHGKKYWKAWKAAQEAKARRPAGVPVEYDDPIAQAAFEAVYKNRLHMLRLSVPNDLAHY